MFLEGRGNTMYCLTVKALKDRIADLPDDMPVLIQRIEDFYFNNNGWSTVPLIWEQTSETDIQLSEYIYAWDAFETKSVDGKIVGLTINAHY